MNKEALSRAAAEARGLAIDAVHACSSGHLGLPLGCADLGAVLFGEGLLSVDHEFVVGVLGSMVSFLALPCGDSASTEFFASFTSHSLTAYEVLHG